MITKLILKILFKATIPLVAVVGIASYGLYMAGGDPLSVLKQVGGGFGERVASLAGSAGSSIDAARKKTTSTLSGGDSGAHETLYRWTDANGVTHFSNTPPEAGQNAEMLQVDPDRNVMTATRSAGNAGTATRVSNGQVGQDAASEPMPGMAGMAQRGLNPSELFGQFTQSQSGNGESRSAGSSMNPAELVEQFKKSQDLRLQRVP